MAWITVADIEQRLAVTNPNGTGEDSQLLAIVADAACAYVEKETGRKFLSATYTRVFDGNGRQNLILPVVPVTAVTSLTVGTSAVSLGTADEYRQGSVSAFWTTDRIVYPGGFPRGFAAVKVVWTAGWTLPNIPDDILSAAVAVAVVMYKERDRYGDESKNLGGQSVQYVKKLNGIDAHTIHSYRNWKTLYATDQGVDV